MAKDPTLKLSTFHGLTENIAVNPYGEPENDVNAANNPTYQESTEQDETGETVDNSLENKKGSVIDFERLNDSSSIGKAKEKESIGGLIVERVSRKKDKTQITVYFDTPIADMIEAYAGTLRMSRSEFVNQLIKQLFEQKG